MRKDIRQMLIGIGSLVALAGGIEKINNTRGLITLDSGFTTIEAHDIDNDRIPDITYVTSGGVQGRYFPVTYSRKPTQEEINKYQEKVEER